MVTAYILGFFMNGVYQLVVLYGFGSVVPIHSPELVLSRGYGIRNVTNLDSMRRSLDTLIPLQIGGIEIPLATFLVIALFCVFIVWFRRTKLGQDMRASGEDMAVAHAAGIPVMRTRVISIIISTVLACYGQIIFLQNVGTMNTYNSHEQAGVFAIASLLVGGATVAGIHFQRVRGRGAFPSDVRRFAHGGQIPGRRRPDWRILPGVRFLRHHFVGPGAARLAAACRQGAGPRRTARRRGGSVGMKRILVNIVIVLCFAGLAYFCYDEGKSYNLILENLSYTVDGVEHPGIEAMQVTIDDSGDPIYMLEGDQMPGVAAGKKHNLKIEILDEDDKVIETRNIPFHILDLKGKFSINVARAYALGKVN